MHSIRPYENDWINKIDSDPKERGEGSEIIKNNKLYLQIFSFGNSDWYNFNGESIESGPRIMNNKIPNKWKTF